MERPGSVHARRGVTGVDPDRGHWQGIMVAGGPTRSSPNQPRSRARRRVVLVGPVPARWGGGGRRPPSRDAKVHLRSRGLGGSGFPKRIRQPPSIWPNPPCRGLAHRLPSTCAPMLGPSRGMAPFVKPGADRMLHPARGRETSCGHVCCRAGARYRHLSSVRTRTWLAERVSISIEVAQEADLGSVVHLLVDESPPDSFARPQIAPVGQPGCFEVGID